jgi:hypothetical protein
MSKGIQRAWILCCAGLLLLLALSACGRGDRDLSDLTVELAIEPSPSRIGPATIRVSLRDAYDRPIVGARVELEGNMSHAGMVPVFAQATEIEPGLYQADLEFTMGGDWFILVRADLPDGRSMERQMDVPAVDSMYGDTPAP